MHYHGTPITPRAKYAQLAGRNFCVSFAEDRDLQICHEVGQSVLLDCGAYTFWRAGRGRVDLDAYARWCAPWLEHPTTWAVIPDVIDGTVADNDQLLAGWERTRVPRGAPVWHMHEPVGRLARLCDTYDRVCIGSSGQYADVGSHTWRVRLDRALNAICGNGPVPVWLHMLRGMALAGSEYPFASVDSSYVAQTHAGNTTRNGRAKDISEMAAYCDGKQCPARWSEREQLELV